MSKGVPVSRFYTVVVLAGVLGFLAGALFGKVEAELKDSQLVIERQKEDYESDIECFKELPAPDDSSFWNKLDTIC